MCKLSAHFAFNTATYERTNRYLLLFVRLLVTLSVRCSRQSVLKTREVVKTYLRPLRGWERLKRDLQKWHWDQFSPLVCFHLFPWTLALAVISVFDFWNASSHLYFWFVFSKLDLCDAGSFSTPTFNSDIQQSVYSFSCFISVCPFVALLKA